MTNAVDTRLVEANTTIEELRALYTALLKKNSEAEDALRFYANPRNWVIAKPPLTTKVYQDQLLEDYTDADNTPNTKVAGSRARLYFAQYGQK